MSLESPFEHCDGLLEALEGLFEPLEVAFLPFDFPFDFLCPWIRSDHMSLVSHDCDCDCADGCGLGSCCDHVCPHLVDQILDGEEGIDEEEGMQEEAMAGAETFRDDSDRSNPSSPSWKAEENGSCSVFYLELDHTDSVDPYHLLHLGRPNGGTRIEASAHFLLHRVQCSLRSTHRKSSHSVSDHTVDDPLDGK